MVMPDADIEASLADAERAREDHQVVAVMGCGIGWYAALAFARVLSLADAGRLVRKLVAVSAEQESAASHLVFPLTDAAWRPDARLRSDLEAAIAAGDGEVRLSVDLGGYAMVDGSPAGIETLIAALPPVRAGDRHYPLRLSSHAVTAPSTAGTEDRALNELAEIDWQTPSLTVIDGRGVRHTPWSADPAALRDYTLGARRTETDDVASAVRVALRDQAPDAIVVAGRGGILGAVCGQLIVAEGYHAIRSRHAFVEAQRRRPIVLSMRH